MIYLYLLSFIQLARTHQHQPQLRVKDINFHIKALFHSFTFHCWSQNPMQFWTIASTNQSKSTLRNGISPYISI